MAITILNNRAINRTDTASAGQNWTATSATASDFQAGGGVNTRNLVSNVGVVASDASGAGTARHYLKAATYGSDKAIFAYGYTDANVSMSNLCSNTGVIASDVSGVGTARRLLGAAGYGN